MDIIILNYIDLYWSYYYFILEAYCFVPYLYYFVLLSHFFMLRFITNCSLYLNNLNCKFDIIPIDRVVIFCHLDSSYLAVNWCYFTIYKTNNTSPSTIKLATKFHKKGNKEKKNKIIDVRYKLHSPQATHVYIFMFHSTDVWLYLSPKRLNIISWRLFLDFLR